MATKVKEKIEEEKMGLLKQINEVKQKLKAVTLAKTNEDISMTIDSE
jgi:hypothetical protein